MTNRPHVLFFSGAAPTNTEILVALDRRAAEKQKAGTRGSLGYKHYTPLGFGAVYRLRNWVTTNLPRAVFETTSLVLLVLFALISAGFADETGRKAAGVAPADNGPRIQFPTTVFDFGKATFGELVNHEFIFTNAGSQPLVIKDVHPGCGCTTVKQWSHEVPPGQEGTVSLSFDTANFSGPVAKSVAVTCNDTNQPVVSLQIKGNVWRPIEVTPQSANFTGPLDSLSNLSRTIKILNQDKEPLTLSSPQTSHRAIAAEIQTNQVGQNYQLLVSLVPPLGAGNLFGEVTMKTSSPMIPVLKVSVFAIVRPGVMVLPAQIEIPSGPATNKFNRTVSIRNNSSNPLKLSQPAVNAKGVEVNLQELQPGQFFSIVLTFPPGFEPVKGETPELSFKSNNPQFALLKVPIVNK